MERDSRKRAEALLAQMTATEKSGAGSARSMVFTVQIHGRKKIMRQGLPGDFPCRHIISYRNM